MDAMQISELTATWAQVAIAVGQLALITWGLWMMRDGATQRDAQLKQQAEQFAELVRRGDRQAEEQSRVLGQQTEALAAVLRRMEQNER